MANSPFCKACDATCRCCSKRGHFQSQCKSVRFSINSTDRDQHDVAFDVDSTSEPHDVADAYGRLECEASAADDYFTLFTVCSKTFDDNPLNRNVYINDTMLRCKVDTRVDCNNLGIKSLPCDMFLQLKPTNVRIKTWESFPLKVLGSCTCKVVYKTKCISASMTASDQLSLILKLHESVFTQEGKLSNYCHEIKID